MDFCHKFFCLQPKTEGRGGGIYFLNETSACDKMRRTRLSHSALKSEVQFSLEIVKLEEVLNYSINSSQRNQLKEKKTHQNWMKN